MKLKQKLSDPSEISAVFLEEFYSTLQENSCKSTMDFIPAGPIGFLQYSYSISTTLKHKTNLFE